MDTTGRQGDLHPGQRAQDTGVWSFRHCAPCGHGAGWPGRGAGSGTHLDTAVVGVPICARGQALQWVREAPTILPGWTLAVHNLEGLELIRGGEGPGAGSCARKLRQDNSRARAAGVREIHRGGGAGQGGTHHRLVLAGLALGRGFSRSTLLLTDLCAGQELAELLHAAEEVQTPLTLPGGREEGRGRRARPERAVLRRLQVPAVAPTKPTREGTDQGHSVGAIGVTRVISVD